MSDEPARLPEGQSQQAKPAGIFEHRCEEPGSTSSAPLIEKAASAIFDAAGTG